MNPVLPISTRDGVENNTLRIDHRIAPCIERKAARHKTPEQKSLSLAWRRISSDILADEVDDSRIFAVLDGPKDGADELDLEGSLMPRAVSSVQCLCHRGEAAWTPGFAARSLSLPFLLASSASPSLSLYDSDLTLILELPDVKRTEDLHLSSGVFQRPKDGSSPGEDSYFCFGPALGVADGVGGLHSVLGYTSKAFADELMLGCLQAVQDILSDSQSQEGAARPSHAAEQILTEGFKQQTTFGACTAIIAVLDNKQATCHLGIASLGDSGVIVVRRPSGKASEALKSRSFIVFKSSTQQHDFNYPFQLCRLPQALCKMLLRSPDLPKDCQTFDIEVEEGDLILVYSDGLSDNLHDEEILEICDRALSPYAAHVLGFPKEAATPADLLAQALGSAAYVRSKDAAAKTPFADEARKAGWPTAWCRGGKQDDITCVSAWVTHISDLEPRLLDMN